MFYKGNRPGSSDIWDYLRWNPAVHPHLVYDPDNSELSEDKCDQLDYNWLWSGSSVNSPTSKSIEWYNVTLLRIFANILKADLYVN